jgi:hypothetical protein
MWSTSHSGVADRRTALAQTPCGQCEHRELIHSDDGPRRCLYSACVCTGFVEHDDAAA